MLGIIYRFPLICSRESNLNQSKVVALLFSFRSRLTAMLSFGVWQMEPVKTVNKKKINLHVNSSTTVKGRSKNFSLIFTLLKQVPHEEVSAKLLLLWKEKYPFSNKNIAVKSRISVHSLLPRTFFFTLFTCIDTNVLYQARILRGVLPSILPSVTRT